MKFLLIFCLTLSLTACGFHLRDSSMIPPELHTLHVKSNMPYSAVTKELQSNLKRAGLKLVDTAPYTITILSENFSLQTFATASALVNQGYLYYNVSYQLAGPQGKILIGPTTISVANTITTNANQMSGTSSEQAVVRNDMIHEAINQLLNQLAANRTKLLLKKTTPQ